MDIFNFSRYCQIIFQNTPFLSVAYDNYPFPTPLFSNVLLLANPMGTKQYLIVILSCMSLITSEMEHVFTFRTWIYLCITYSNSLLMALFMCFLLIYGGSLYLVDLMLPLLHTWPSLSNSGIFFTYTSPTTTTKVTLSLTFKNLFIYLFLERREGRKTGRETSMCERYIGWLPPGPQPRHVPWLRIKLMTFWFSGPHSTHWATLARAVSNILCICVMT